MPTATKGNHDVPDGVNMVKLPITKRKISCCSENNLIINIGL